MSSEQSFHAFRVSSKNQDPAQRAASLHAAVSCPSFNGPSRNRDCDAEDGRSVTAHLPNHLSYSMHTFGAAPPSPSKDKNGHTRMRASQACETCRVRKRKCSGQKPTCGRCGERGLKCVWSDIVSHRGQQKPRLRRVPAMASLKPTLSSDSSSASDGVSPVTPVGESFTYDSVRAGEGPSAIIAPTPMHAANFAGAVTMSAAPSENNSNSNSNSNFTPTYGVHTTPHQKEHVESSSPFPSPPHFAPNSYYDGFSSFGLPCPPLGSSGGDLYASYLSSGSDGTSSFPSIPFPEHDHPKHASSQISSSLPPSIQNPLGDYPNGGNSWVVEILDPVVGSFLNPAPMVDTEYNPVQAWGHMYQDLPPDFGFLDTVMPSDSPYHNSPRGSAQW